jgi:hypothetical protein
LSPRGEFCPLGVKLSRGEIQFSVCPFIFLNSRECSPLGVNEGVKIPPRGLISPLSARGEVKNGPLKLEAYPAIVSCNASVVKTYSTTCCLLLLWARVFWRSRHRKLFFVPWLEFFLEIQKNTRVLVVL